jgi:MoaA/NifB/PqqE/SkfB family radical SAM enzyme
MKSLRMKSLRMRSPGRLAAATHVTAKAWRGRGEGAGGAARRALVHAALIEGVRLLFGWGGAASHGAAYYPTTFLPDLHSPHFDRALRCLVDPTRGPFIVHLALTGACPWTCRYCYAGAGGKGAPDLGDVALARVARALAAERVPIVLLGGGEPLKRFDRAVRAIEVLADASEVRLATSGAGLTAARASELRRAGLRALAVSLDSDDRARVDATRGPGAFDAAARALGIAANTGLLTLVTSIVGAGDFATPRDAERFLAWVRERHPGAIVNFIPEFGTGRAGARGFATPAAYAPTARRLARAIRRGDHRASAFYTPGMDAFVGCVGAGLRQAVIDIEGNLSACVSGASFGNLLEEPFDVVWRRMLTAPARLTRGFFCAEVAAELGARRTLSPEETLRALRGFHATHDDAWFESLLHHAGPALGWLLRE